jgi:hypothetical protein
MQFKTRVLIGSLCFASALLAPLAKALTTTEIVQLTKPAIVLIECKNSQDPSQSQFGTGFFVNSDTIITNDHVMRGTYGRLSVHKLDGTFFNIEAIAYSSPQEDVCVLKTKEKYNLAHLDLSTVDPLEGDSIVVIGNPEGLTGTISQGIVSALRPGGVMQITAPVTHGSSGSPVLSMDGRVVGIVDRSANRNEANIGFARDLVTIEHVLSWAKNSHFGNARSLTVAPVPPVDHVAPTPITRESAAWRAQQIWRQEAAAKLRKARGGPVETEKNVDWAHPSREALMQLQEGWEVTNHPDTAAIDKITGEIMAGKRK